MYAKIVNPNTGRRVSIYGKTGKQILRNYVDSINGGGLFRKPNCTDGRNRDHGCPCDEDLQCKNNVCEYDIFKKRKVCLTDAQRKIALRAKAAGKGIAKGAKAAGRGIVKGAKAAGRGIVKGAKAVAKGAKAAGKALAGDCPNEYPKRWRGMNCDGEDDCCQGMACQYDCAAGYQMAPAGHRHAGKIVCNDAITLKPSNVLAWKKCSQVRGYPILNANKHLREKAKQADAWTRQAGKDINAWTNQAGKDINAWGNQASKDISTWANQAGKDIKSGMSNLGASISGHCNMGTPGQYLNRGDNCGPGIGKDCCPNTVCQDNCPFGSVVGPNGSAMCRVSPNGPPGNEQAWPRCSMVKGHVGKQMSFTSSPRAAPPVPRRMRGGGKPSGERCNYNWDCASNNCNDPDPTCFPNPTLGSDGHSYCMMGPRSQTGHPRQRAEKICL